MTPQQALPEELGGRKEFPIFIALPPYEIEAFLKNLPQTFQDKYDDFVFFAGGLDYGNIEDVLKENGYRRDSMTQVLISGLKTTGALEDLSVKLGADAMGEEKWAGECSACGKWNAAVAERLERADVRCNVDFYRDFRRKMWERNIYDAVFHLVGAVREEPTTLADVANYYEEEVSDIVWEISQQLRGWKAMTLIYGFEERLFGIGEQRGSETQCTLLEGGIFGHIWGSKVFTDSNTFLDYLWYAKETRGLLPNTELPPKRGEGQVSSIMRQGNLRANGEI